MKKIIKTVSILLLLFTGISNLSSASVNADDSSGYDYTVGITPPDNQIGDNSGFFDVKLVPGQATPLTLTLTNNSNTPQTYTVQVNTAATNSNVIVNYSKTDAKLNNTAKYNIKDLIYNPNPTVTVPANSSQQLTLNLNSPSEAFDGILLGGVTITPNQSKESSGGISNVYTRTVGIRAKQTDTVITPDLTASDVVLSQRNLHNVASLQLQNITPTLITKLTGKYNITKKGSTDPVISGQNTNLSIAPNTDFPYSVEWDDLFNPGDYTFHLTLENSQHKWDFSKDFTIKGEEAKEYNDTSVNESKTDHTILYFSLLIGFLILLLIGSWLFFFLKRKKDKDDEDKK
ncbi:DUF916 and DUF3324 domain-containing protein [Holzapfeliella sp. He02]|uniref:DUF916 and DUF3324 domain-containing protein n=1 Tax=Holzapfeliella saturejae TaxID=3082953 RepID=A0ABU8SHR5_9LACO